MPYNVKQFWKYPALFPTVFNFRFAGQISRIQLICDNLEKEISPVRKKTKKSQSSFIHNNHFVIQGEYMAMLEIIMFAEKIAELIEKFPLQFFLQFQDFCTFSLRSASFDNNFEPFQFAHELCEIFCSTGAHGYKKTGIISKTKWVACICDWWTGFEGN